jgi:hypothetical protein
VAILGMSDSAQQQGGQGERKERSFHGREA